VKLLSPAPPIMAVVMGIKDDRVHVAYHDAAGCLAPCWVEPDGVSQATVSEVMPRRCYVAAYRLVASQ